MAAMPRGSPCKNASFGPGEGNREGAGKRHALHPPLLCRPQGHAEGVRRRLPRTKVFGRKSYAFLRRRLPRHLRPQAALRHRLPRDLEHKLLCAAGFLWSLTSRCVAPQASSCPRLGRASPQLLHFNGPDSRRSRMEAGCGPTADGPTSIPSADGLQPFPTTLNGAHCPSNPHTPPALACATYTYSRLRVCLTLVHRPPVTSTGRRLRLYHHGQRISSSVHGRQRRSGRCSRRRRHRTVRGWRQRGRRSRRPRRRRRRESRGDGGG